MADLRAGQFAVASRVEIRSEKVCITLWTRTLDDDSGIPEDLRLTFKILKNSNCLPIEMELRKEIFSLRQLFGAAIDPKTRRELRRDLNLRILRFNTLRRRTAVGLDLPQI